MEMPLSLSPSATEKSLELPGVPPEYLDLRAVVSKAKAASLPPHRPYDMAIILLPGTSPPEGRLYSLSVLETEAMNTYIEESLAAGIIYTSSPAGAGFFFVGKKDVTLRPCKDYRGLDNITVKNRCPLPLMSPAFELLQALSSLSLLPCPNKRGRRVEDGLQYPFRSLQVLWSYQLSCRVPVPDQRCFVRHAQRVCLYLNDILIFSQSVPKKRETRRSFPALPRV